MSATDTRSTTAPAGSGSIFSRLYSGTGAFPIIPRRRTLFVVAGVITLVCLASILLRGFTFGIDFTGGTKLSMPAAGVVETRASSIVEETTGHAPEAVRTVGTGSARVVEIETEFLATDQIVDAKKALFDAFHPVDAEGNAAVDAIGDSARSESWGGQVTKKALLALGVFLVVIFAYIAFRFEWQMALAAIIALLFDLVTTAGVYSIVGFEVAPATVIGLLTILGFSLYDTVVVFDKVQENTRGIRHRSGRTYAEEANLAVNQTLMRSINTTIIGLLPLVALVVIAVWMLGVGTLKDLALVQIVGIVSGTFSSIFLATPLLVAFKNRTATVREHNTRVGHRRSAQAAAAGSRA